MSGSDTWRPWKWFSVTVSLPLRAHHHSSTQADRWFQLAQLQVISCSLVCLWNASGVPLRTLRTHFRALSSLNSIRTNGLPACCQLGEGKKKKKAISVAAVFQSFTHPQKSAVVLRVFIQNREESSERLMWSQAACLQGNPSPLTSKPFLLFHLCCWYGFDLTFLLTVADVQIYY